MGEDVIYFNLVHIYFFDLSFSLLKSTFRHSTHLHLSEHMDLFLKHSQYFLRHLWHKKTVEVRGNKLHFVPLHHFHSPITPTRTSLGLRLFRERHKVLIQVFPYCFLYLFVVVFCICTVFAFTERAAQRTSSKTFTIKFQTVCFRTFASRKIFWWRDVYWSLLFIWCRCDGWRFHLFSCLVFEF